MSHRRDSMQQKINFATWWGYISGRKCYFYTLTTKMRHQVAKFNFCFIQETLNFLLYHMQYLQYPRSGALQKFCGDLNIRPYHISIPEIWDIFQSLICDSVFTFSSVR